MADLFMSTEQDRLAERMNSKRAIMERQIMADKVKSDLCNCIGGEIRADPELDQNFATVAETMPKLAAFISRMRYVSQGVWCGKCNDIKNVTAPNGTVLYAQPMLVVPVETVPAALSVIAEETTETADDNDTLARLQENFDAIRTAMSEMNQTYVARYKELFASLNENAKVLAFLTEADHMD